MAAGKRFLITGAAGFIGSAVVRHLIEETPAELLVVDKLTGLANTVRRYVDYRSRWQRIRAGVYRGERLGLVS